MQSVLLEFQAVALQDEQLRDEQRAAICSALAEADKCLSDGVHRTGLCPAAHCHMHENGTTEDTFPALSARQIEQTREKISAWCRRLGRVPATAEHGQRGANRHQGAWLNRGAPKPPLHGCSSKHAAHGRRQVAWGRT